jgi:hypothetical protein
VGVAVATYVVALPRVAPASVSDTYGLSHCNSWTRDGTTLWDCAARNSFPDCYIGDFSTAFFDVIHKPGKTVRVSIVKRSFSGSTSSDSKNVQLSSGSSPVFKEYSVTPSQVLVMSSRWDYVYLGVSGVEELIGTAIVTN